LPKRETPVQNFAKRYTHDVSYKEVVTKELMEIIENDVSAISLNPVFGSLWRAVCNDRGTSAREDLAKSFSMQIEKITDEEEKTE
jgi:hypothetical protein